MKIVNMQVARHFTNLLRHIYFYGVCKKKKVFLSFGHGLGVFGMQDKGLG